MRIYDFELERGCKIAVKPPTVRAYNNLMSAKSDDEIIDAIAQITEKDRDYIENNFTHEDLRKFIMDFPLWVHNIKKSDPN